MALLEAKERRDEALRLAVDAIEEAADTWELDDLESDDEDDVRNRLRKIGEGLKRQRTLVL